MSEQVKCWRFRLLWFDNDGKVIRVQIAEKAHFNWELAIINVVCDHLEDAPHRIDRIGGYAYEMHMLSMAHDNELGPGTWLDAHAMRWYNTPEYKWQEEQSEWMLTEFAQGAISNMALAIDLQHQMYVMEMIEIDNKLMGYAIG